MGAPQKPILYREIQFHGGITVPGKIKSKRDIQRADGLTIPRHSGTGMTSFNAKIIGRDTARFGSVCRYCNELHSNLTVDHVIAWSLVGDYMNGLNVAQCCKTCNEAYNSRPKKEAIVARIIRENREYARRVGPADPWRANNA